MWLTKIWRSVLCVVVLGTMAQQSLYAQGGDAAREFELGKATEILSALRDFVISEFLSNTQA